MQPTLSACVRLIVLGACGSSALAQVAQETRGDAPFVEPEWRPRGPAYELVRRGERGGVELRQVNLDANGLNVLGDAANEPSIGVDPTAPNRIVIAWRQFDAITSSFRQAGTSISRDGGRTWSSKLTLTPGVFRTDPVVRFDSSGHMMLDSLRITNGRYFCDAFLSDDAGLTWEAPIDCYGGDKAWIAIDATGSASHGFIYQTWNIAGNQYSPRLFNRSLDGGRTWEPPVEIPASPVFGTNAVGVDGEVYVCGVSNSFSTDRFWFSTSLDARDPDATPTFSTTDRTGFLGGRLRGAMGPNPAGLLGQVQTVVDSSAGPRRGWIYVLCSVDRTSTPDQDAMDVMLTRSTDGGVTFSPPIRVNADAPGPNSWQWMGTISISPDGRLDACWIDTRESQDMRRGRVYFRSSADGGETWGEEIALTPEWDSFLGWPQQNKIGDYYDMHSDRVGADITIATTLNGEQDVYYVRVGDRDCDGSGSSDEAQIAGDPSTDCDGDGVLDSCEIAAGEARDCNTSGVIDACEPVGCSADLADPRGVLNIFDFLAFQGLFGEGAPCADLAPPAGDLNVFDFLAFQTAFAQGC